MIAILGRPASRELDERDLQAPLEAEDDVVVPKAHPFGTMASR
ncbi:MULTISPECIES: hypothetical protein [Paraburkholderia]|uniref:Uncharacterized protein n=1 Tax=Paraburkholderia guartelaensis TaxID=2546446 RepID=A0ABU9SH17_9BURK|nr:hypothetical protein [Paraburkholderia nodosa]